MEQQFFFHDCASSQTLHRHVLLLTSSASRTAHRSVSSGRGHHSVMFDLHLIQIFQCRPVAYFWNRFKPNSSGSCLSLEAFFAFLETVNAIEIATDIVLAVLPCAMAWNMKMKRSKKITVAIMLDLGSL